MKLYKLLSPSPHPPEARGSTRTDDRNCSRSCISYMALLLNNWLQLVLEEVDTAIAGNLDTVGSHTVKADTGMGFA